MIDGYVLGFHVLSNVSSVHMQGLQWTGTAVCENVFQVWQVKLWFTYKNYLHISDAVFMLLFGLVTLPGLALDTHGCIFLIAQWVRS